MYHIFSFRSSVDGHLGCGHSLAIVNSLQWTFQCVYHFQLWLSSGKCPRIYALISPSSNVMLKIFQARLQQYVNWELLDAQVGFRKGRGTRDQIVNIHWNPRKSKRIPENIYFCFIDYTKAFDCVDQKKLWEILRDGNTRLVSWETCILVRKQQLELEMEQWAVSKLGKEYIKAVYCHPAYLTYMQSTSCEMPG